MVQLTKKSPVSITAIWRSLPMKQRMAPTTMSVTAFHIPKPFTNHPPAIFPNIDTAPNTMMSVAFFVMPVVKASPANERPTTMSMMRRMRNTLTTLPLEG